MSRCARRLSDGDRIQIFMCQNSQLQQFIFVASTECKQAFRVELFFFLLNLKTWEHCTTLFEKKLNALFIDYQWYSSISVATSNLNEFSHKTGSSVQE